MVENNKKDEILSEILSWQRLQGIRILRDIIPSILDDDKKRKAYEMTDGKKSTKEIAKPLGVSKDVIVGWWREWFSQGIVNRVPQKGGGHPLCKKIISIKDIVMDMKGLRK